jgi:hypothetical protein
MCKGDAMTERLKSREIVLLRSLASRGASLRAVSIDRYQRSHALPLWRRGLIEIWYRQSPDAQPSLQGPYYGLTVSGAKLASNFL